MAGRPHELDDIVSRRVCNALEAGSSRTAAAAAARISMTTLMSWLARGRDGEEPFAEFLACVREAEGTAETLVTDALFKTALAGEKAMPMSATRAREDVDVAVREIVGLMTDGKWVTGKSNHYIADKYGVAVATVKDWATSASRVIRLCVSLDPDEVRARYVATLEGIAASAMSKQSATMSGELYDTPDHKAAIQAIAESAKLAGLVVQKHEVNPTEEQARETWKRLTGQEWKPEGGE